MNGEDITPHVEPSPRRGGPSGMPPLRSRPQVRSRPAVRQFERWVDRMLEGEDPPAGLPPEIMPRRARRDRPARGRLYALYWGLTKLSDDVRLQRGHSRTSPRHSPLEKCRRMDGLESAAASRRAAGARSAAFESEACDSGLPAPVRPSTLLFDLYDRMERSHGRSTPSRGRSGGAAGRPARRRLTARPGPSGRSPRSRRRARGRG